MPVFNEAAVLPILLRRIGMLMEQLDGPAEAIFVDDGSSDCGPVVLRSLVRDDPRYRYIGLSRNFGHQVAITAGMDAAAGEAIIVMDADLQDPPEIVGEMIAKWKEGFEVVYARRLSRAGESAFKRTSANLFYKLLGRMSSIVIPADVGDFRLIDRKVLGRVAPDAGARSLYKRHDRLAGLSANRSDISSLAAVGGRNQIPVWKMVRLAVNGALSFSDAPLRLAIWFGLAVSACAVFYGFYVAGLWFMNSHLVEGWSSTIIVISFLCGINMLMTGIMGLYIGRIHAEVKRRPLYVVSQRLGFEPEPKPVRTLLSASAD